MRGKSVILGVLCLVAVFCFAMPAMAAKVEPETEGEWVSITFSQSEYELTTTNHAWVRVRFYVTPADTAFLASPEDFKATVTATSPLEVSLVRLQESEEGYNTFDVTFQLQSGLLPGEKSKSVSYTVKLTPVGEHKDLLAKGSCSKGMWVKYRPFDPYPIQEALDTMWVEELDYGYAHANAGYLPATVIRMLKMELQKGQSMNVNFGSYGVVFTQEGLLDLKSQAIDFYASDQEHAGFARRIEEAGFTGDVTYLRFEEQQLTAPLQLYVKQGKCYIYAFDQEKEKFSRQRLTYDGHVYTFTTDCLTSYVITEKPLPLEIVDPSTALFTAGEDKPSTGLQLVPAQEEQPAEKVKLRLPTVQEYVAESVREKVQWYLN